jgi:hypothetical protein
MIAGGQTITTFTFSTLPVLSDNTAYAFVFTDGAGTRVPARMGLTDATDIADGTLFGGGAQQFGNGFDMAMRIDTVVPEPSTAFLAALSGLALLRRRR